MLFSLAYSYTKQIASKVILSFILMALPFSGLNLVFLFLLPFFKFYLHMPLHVLSTFSSGTGKVAGATMVNKGNFLFL